MWFVKMAKSFYFLLGHSYWCHAAPRKRLSGAWGPNYKRHVVTPSSRLSGWYSAIDKTHEIFIVVKKKHQKRSYCRALNNNNNKMYFLFRLWCFGFVSLFFFYITRHQQISCMIFPSFFLSIFLSLLCIMLFIYLTMMAYNYNAQCAVCAPLVVAYSFFSGVGSNDGSKLSFKFHHSNKQDTTHKLLGKRRGGNARLDVLLCTTWRQSSTTFSTTSRKERTFDSIRHSKIAPSSYRSRESREVRTRAKSNNGCREWPMMDESFRTQKMKNEK